MKNAIQCRKKYRLFEMKFGLQYGCNMGKEVFKVNVWKIYYLQMKCRIMCSISKAYSRKCNRGKRTENYIIGRSRWKLNSVQEPQL